MAVKVAVIGAGATAAALGYHLVHGFGDNHEAQLINQDVKLTIFEREPEAGGRAKRVEFAGTKVEIGGTIVHSANKYIQELMGYAGANKQKPDLTGESDEFYGFWNGSKMYMCVKNQTSSFAAKLLSRYGALNCQRFLGNANKIMNKWSRIYQIQEGKIKRVPDCWSSTEEFLTSTKLSKVASRTYAYQNKKSLITKGFTKTFAEPILNNMYNQDSSINALAGNIALAGAGLGGELFQIEGGNGQLFGTVLSKLQGSSKSKVKVDCKFSATITKITIEDDCVKVNLEGNSRSQKFDKLIITTPIETSNIEIQNNSKSEISKYITGNQISRKNRMQKVYVTLVEGEIDREYFELNTKKMSKKAVPSTIFTRPNVGLQYKSVGITGKSDSGTPIYKIFSEEKLSPELFPQMFKSYNRTHQHIFNGAFFKLDPLEEGFDFELVPGQVFYTSQLEKISSAMEVAAISGVNVAKLLLGSLK